MDEFIPVPYNGYTGLLMIPFLQKNFGLTLPKPTNHQSTQTEPPTNEVSTQTKKQPGLLWGYFG